MNKPQVERRKYPAPGSVDRRVKALPRCQVTWKKEYRVRRGVDRRQL